MQTFIERITFLYSMATREACHVTPHRRCIQNIIKIFNRL